MDSQATTHLGQLLRNTRVASLGSLKDGAPLTTLVIYAAAPDFSAFYVHVSRLALHTQNLLADSRAGLMIAEIDTGEKDPLTLARVSILGRSVEIPTTAPDYQAAKSVYLDRHPEAARNFELGDFHLLGIEPKEGRFVAGFGRIYDLGPDDFVRAADAA